MQGFFIALVVIGAKKEEAALTIPLRGRDTRELFSNTAFSAGGR